MSSTKTPEVVKIPDLPENFDATSTSRTLPNNIKAPKNKNMITYLKGHKYGYWEAIVRVQDEKKVVGHRQLTLHGKYGSIVPMIINPKKPNEIGMELNDLKGRKTEIIDTKSAVKNRTLKIGIQISSGKLFQPDIIEVFFNGIRVWKTRTETRFGIGQCKWTYDMSESNPLDVSFTGSWIASRKKEKKLEEKDTQSKVFTPIFLSEKEKKNMALNKNKIENKAKRASENAKKAAAESNFKAKKAMTAAEERAKKASDKANKKAALLKQKAKDFQGDSKKKAKLEKKAEAAAHKAKSVEQEIKKKTSDLKEKIESKAILTKMKAEEKSAEAEEKAKVVNDEYKGVIEEKGEKGEKETGTNPIGTFFDGIGGMFGGRNEEKQDSDEATAKEALKTAQEAVDEAKKQKE